MQAQSPSPVQPTTGADHREDTLWSRWRSLPRLLRLLWTLGRRDMLLVAAFSLVYGLAPLLALITLQRLVDSAVDVVAGKTTLTTALRWLAVLFLVDGLHVVFELWSSLIDDMEDRLKLRVQERLLRKAHRLSLAAFERPAVYDQLHRAQQGLDTRLATILSNLLPMPSYLVQAISLLIYVGSAHLFFPLVMLLGLLPTYGLFTRHFRRTYWLERKHTAPERRLRYLQDLMVERRAAAEIRLFGLGSYLLARYQQLFGQLRDDRLEFARARQRTDIPRIIGKALTAGLVVVGLVVLIVQRRLSIGAFAAYLLATERLGGATFGVIWSAARIDGDLRYIQDLFEYLDLEEESQIENHQPELEPSVLSPQSSVLSPQSLPAIRFENVSFAYPGADSPVLDGLTFTLNPGERMALVGENGAGKSTLAKLLLGLYRPSAGRITVDSVDLVALDPPSWRKRVAAVFQDFVKYELTARQNIGFGNLRCLDDDAAIATAAARSGADEVVATLPAGYATMLGKAYDEQGQDLSIGQWQKLAIARAYLRDALVLVLDEPAAALDARAEVETYRRFRDMSHGKSVLLISHRLGSARLADRILVLEGGRIVEQGSHDDLMACGGRYAQMYAIQAQWYQ